MGRVARLTNHTWAVDADEIAAWAGAPVGLLNDLEAMAYSLEVLAPHEQVVLQAGRARRPTAMRRSWLPAPASARRRCTA